MCEFGSVLIQAKVPHSHSSHTRTYTPSCMYTLPQDQCIVYPINWPYILDPLKHFDLKFQSILGSFNKEKVRIKLWQSILQCLIYKYHEDHDTHHLCFRTKTPMCCDSYESKQRSTALWLRQHPTDRTDTLYCLTSMSGRWVDLTHSLFLDVKVRANIAMCSRTPKSCCFFFTNILLFNWSLTFQIRYEHKLF